MATIDISNFNTMSSKLSPAAQGGLHRTIFNFIPPQQALSNVSQLDYRASMYPNQLTVTRTPALVGIIGGGSVQRTSAFCKKRRSNSGLNDDLPGEMFFYIPASGGNERVYSMSRSGFNTNYGNPNLGTGSSFRDIITFGGKLFLSSNGSTIKYIDSPTNTWQSLSITNGAGRVFLETFGSKLYFTQDVTGNIGTRQIGSITSSLLVSQNEFDAGVGSNVVDMINVDDAELQIIVSTPSNGASEYRVYKWNGVAGVAASSIINLKGMYLGSIQWRGYIYYITSDEGDMIFSVPSGGFLTEVVRIKNCKLYNPAYLDDTTVRFCIHKGYLVFLSSVEISNPDNTTTFLKNGIMYLNLDTKEYFQGLSASFYVPNNRIIGLIDFDADSFLDSNLFIVTGDIVSNTASISPVFTLTEPKAPTSEVMVNNALYQSNMIEIPAPKPDGSVLLGTIGRGKINRIDVLYNNPPQISGDTLSFTIRGVDALTNTVVVHNAVVTHIDGTPTNAIVDTGRAIINNIGMLCTHFTIDMSMNRASGSTWDLSVMKILVDFTPVDVNE